MSSLATNGPHPTQENEIMNRNNPASIAASTETTTSRADRGWLLGLGTIVLSTIAVGAATVATTAAAPNHKKLHFVEHELTSDMTDNGVPGLSAGDVFTVHSAMLDGTHKEVGRVDIYGVVTETHGDEGSFAGTGMLHLPGGMIAFASGGFEPEHTLAVITGGTGSYRGATGDIVIVETEGSPDADITITLRN